MFIAAAPLLERLGDLAQAAEPLANGRPTSHKGVGRHENITFARGGILYPERSSTEGSEVGALLLCGQPIPTEARGRPIDSTSCLNAFCTTCCRCAGRGEQMAVDMMTLFEGRMSYPHPDARRRLARLVGLDDQISKLTKVLGLLVHPRGLQRWGAQHHPGATGLIESVLARPPLVIFGGDVGSGKTELAETIPDAVARQEGIEIDLLPLSLSARGQGRIGEITQLISAAFDFTLKEASTIDKNTEGSEGAVILLVDEADALAQSRETPEMQHEEISGVNAFIRGIDRLANRRVPAAVIMCTNRYDSLDPAITRRAAEILTFGRPDEEKRRLLLGPKLSRLGFNEQQIEAIVVATGPRSGEYGFTFSDLAQRLLPAIVLDAYPEKSILPSRALHIARQMKPTPP